MQLGHEARRVPAYISRQATATHVLILLVLHCCFTKCRKRDKPRLEKTNNTKKDKTSRTGRKPKKMEKIEKLVQQLDDFDPEVREKGLRELKTLTEQGIIKTAPGRGWVNLHGHTFFSFNAYGFSPSRFLWEAFSLGLEMVGIVDFDVLDGLEEALGAAQILGIKAEVGMETRVFVKEYGVRVINSPGEPGIFYLMGTGFFRKPEKGSQAETVLNSLKKRASSRNLLVIQKVNEYLNPVTVDYKNDVLPLTPKGNATERHILSAYVRKASVVFPKMRKRTSFWSEILKLRPKQLRQS